MDAEPARPLPEGVLTVVARPDELGRLRRLTATVPETSWDRLLSCAEEAVHEAWSPLAGRWLDSSDVRVDVHPQGTLSAGVLVSGPDGGVPLPGSTGRSLVRDDLLRVAVPGMRGRQARR